MPYNRNNPPPPPPRVRPPPLPATILVVEEEKQEEIPPPVVATTTSPTVKPLPPLPPSQKPFRRPQPSVGEYVQEEIYQPTEEPLIEHVDPYYDENQQSNQYEYQENSYNEHQVYYDENQDGSNYGEAYPHYDENHQSTNNESYYQREPQQGYSENQQYDEEVENYEQENSNQQEEYQQQVESVLDQPVYSNEDQKSASLQDSNVIEEPIMEPPTFEDYQDETDISEQVLVLEQAPSRPPIPASLDIIIEDAPSQTAEDESSLNTPPSQTLVSETVVPSSEVVKNLSDADITTTSTSSVEESKAKIDQPSLLSILEGTSSFTPLPGVQKKVSKRPQRKERSRDRVGELFKKADNFFEQNIEIQVKDFSKEEEIVEEVPKSTPVKSQPMFMMNQAMLEGIKLKKSSTPVVLKKVADEESLEKKEETPKKPSWIKEKTPLVSEEKASVQTPPWANALKKNRAVDSTISSTSTSENTPSSSTTSENTKTESGAEGKKSLFERKFGNGSDNLSSPSSKFKPSIFGSPLPYSSTLPAGFTISKFKKSTEEETEQKNNLEEIGANKDESKLESNIEKEQPKAEETKPESIEESKLEEGPKATQEKKEEPKDDLSPIVTPKKAESFKFGVGSQMLRATESPFVSPLLKEEKVIDNSPKGSLKDRIAMLEKKPVAQAPPQQVDFRSVLKKRPNQ